MARYRLITDSYTKTQTDASLALKANSAEVYSKTDGDGRYRLITDSYTKTQTDASLALKANSADVYSKTEGDGRYRLITDSYTKTEVDAKILAPTALTNYYTKSESDSKFSPIKSFSFNKTSGLTDWVYFGKLIAEYAPQGNNSLVPHNIRFDICTTVDASIADKGQLQNYTVLFKSSSSLTTSTPDSNPNTPSSVIHANVVGFVLTSSSDRTNEIQFRVYEDDGPVRDRQSIYLLL
jgi:hypothetical protein